MIIDRLRQTVRQFPEKHAITYENYQIKFSELDEITNQLANGLRNCGIKAGDRIILLMPNLPHFVFSYYAILKIGAIAVPLNYMMEDDEFDSASESIKPRAIIYWAGFRKYVSSYVKMSSDTPLMIVLGEKKTSDHFSLLDLISQSPSDVPPVEIRVEDTALIQFTSGVSEPPKGVELSYQNLLTSIEACSKFYRFTESNVFGAILPLFFIFSQNVLLNCPLIRGGTVVLHSKLDYQAIARSIDEHKITVLAGSPNFYHRLTDLSPELFSGSSLKYCLSSWHKISGELAAKFEKRFGIPLLNCYSMTETCGIVAANHHSFERKNDSVGLAVPDIDIQIHNEQGEPLDLNEIGEIAIQGKSVMKNYWNGTESMPQRIRNGWYYTGDLGKIDEQGYIYLINKKAEVIVKSGFPIYTSEIEQLLANHPKVKEAVVVATPHPDHKEDVKACLVLKENETATSDEIVEYCKSHMPVYKCPQVIEFYASLPRTKMGRVFKRKLKEVSN